MTPVFTGRDHGREPDEDSPSVTCVTCRPLRNAELFVSLVKAKFYFASWFEAGSELVRAEIWSII